MYEVEKVKIDQWPKEKSKKKKCSCRDKNDGVESEDGPCFSGADFLSHPQLFWRLPLVS